MKLNLDVCMYNDDRHFLWRNGVQQNDQQSTVFVRAFSLLFFIFFIFIFTNNIIIITNYNLQNGFFPLLKYNFYKYKKICINYLFIKFFIKKCWWGNEFESNLITNKIKKMLFFSKNYIKVIKNHQPAKKKNIVFNPL